MDIKKDDIDLSLYAISRGQVLPPLRYYLFVWACVLIACLYVFVNLGHYVRQIKTNKKTQAVLKQRLYYFNKYKKYIKKEMDIIAQFKELDEYKKMSEFIKSIWPAILSNTKDNLQLSGLQITKSDNGAKLILRLTYKPIETTDIDMGAIMEFLEGLKKSQAGKFLSEPTLLSYRRESEDMPLTFVVGADIL